MSDVDAEFREVFEQLDAEGRAELSLFIYATQRGDATTCDALMAWARCPREDNAEAECEVDFDLLARMASICPKDEARAWGRALAHCVERGDNGKNVFLHDLMLRRVAA